MAAAEPAAGGATGQQVVEFRHPYFAKLGDLHFRRDEQSGEPVAMVSLGTNIVGMSFRGIQREWNITDDSPDGAMLRLIARGLDFVRGLRLGDPIPREILTREASWQPSERHRIIAHQRLTLQLVSWMSGEEQLITDPDQLQQLADDPLTRKRVNQAFGAVAERLGLGRERRQEVIGLIDQLAGELAYIEALRDVFNQILATERKVQGLRKLYGHERGVFELADPVARLMVRAIKHLGGLFEQMDAQTGEIMAVLRNIGGHVGFIQDTRDQLHCRLMAWEDLLAQWRGVEIAIAPENPDRLRAAYRFLAPRYMPVHQWTLVSKALDRPAGPAAVKAEAKPSARRGGVMKW